MNFFLFLLGLFGWNTVGSTSQAGFETTTTKDDKNVADKGDDIVTTPFKPNGNGDMDNAGDDQGDMDMGDMDMGDDGSRPGMGGMDMGDGPGMGGDGMDMGGNDNGSQGGMDMGDMDMGGDGGHSGHGGNHGNGGHSGGHSDHGGGHGSHGGHDVDLGTPSITPPGVGASQAEINTFLNNLAAAPETHVHNHGDSRMSEHDALMDLVPRDAATHTAIGNGDWDDPSIWANGEVPGDGARVLIPEGVQVDYNSVSDARLFTVRVDGALDFATDEDSQMIFDTFVVSPGGHLIMGTADNPVDPDVNIDLIVADNGRIDTNWDPMLLSRGLISHGDITVHGAEKDSHEKVADDPMAGDTSIRFDTLPEGWQVGDTIVIAGTEYDGYRWDNAARDRTFNEPEDEVRVISGIDGNRVFFEQPLEYDHDTPREDLATSVANYTRNVSIESENGADSDVFERGHVMFMHSDEVDVRYMEFTELGRTDKSEDSQAIGDINNVRFDSNVQGRYSLHLHRTGVDDPENPTILEGNAVYGSPGWGVVHHDSNAILSNNATYDTFGAGFVAETGNETGIWEDNIAIFAQGIGWDTPKNTSEIHDSFDVGRGGDGFWFQGRMVAAVDNVAASVNTGFVYFHRDHTDTMIDFDASLFDFPDALNNADQVTPDDVPIMIFEGNETFAAREGLHVVKSNTAQGHDVWSRLEDFTAWSVLNGAELEYTSHYILSDFDLIAREPERFSDPQDGITLGNNMTEIVIINSRIEGFENGIDLNKDLAGDAEARFDESSNVFNYVVIDPTFVDVDNEFINRDGRDTILDNMPNRPYEMDLDVSLQVLNSDAVSITGTKTDGLGRTEFPGGMDDFTIARDDVAGILDTTGYWTTSGGQAYTLVDVYFTDRLTGDIYYETHQLNLNGLPYGNDRVAGGIWANNVNNGVQDIGMRGGQLMAGDTVLGEPVAVASPTIQTMSPSINALNMPATYAQTLSMMPEQGGMGAMGHDHSDQDHGDHDHGDQGAHMHDHAGHSMSDGMDAADMMMSETSAGAVMAETWVHGADSVDPMGLFMDDMQGPHEGHDAAQTETVVVATEASSEDGASRMQAVFDAAAEVGFDANSDASALPASKEDAAVTFLANDNDLGLLTEFNASALDDMPDMGHMHGDMHDSMMQADMTAQSHSVTIDMASLSDDARATVMQMSPDEIVTFFENNKMSDLGDQDARVIIDYASDSIRLELTEGSGSVAVETVGDGPDITSGQEALWDALTNGQGVVSDTMRDKMDEDMLLADVA